MCDLNFVLVKPTPHHVFVLPWVSSDLVVPGVGVLNGDPGSAQHLHLLGVIGAQEPATVRAQHVLVL